MKMKHCKYCGRMVAHKRRIGVGTLIMVVVTAGFGLLAIPFYEVRCTICGGAPVYVPPGKKEEDDIFVNPPHKTIPSKLRWWEKGKIL